MAVSKRDRFEVMRRDAHTCRYCGRRAPDVTLHVDHVVPVALGGSDDPSNLATACVDCNSGKASVSPDGATVADVSAHAERWSSALAAAAAELGSADDDRTYGDQFIEYWTQFRSAGGMDIPVPDGWRASVNTFRDSGLPLDSLLDAVDRAMGAKGVARRDVFRYMCGIAWKRIRAIQDRAEELMALDQEAVDEERRNRSADPLDEPIALADILRGATERAAEPPA